MNSAHACGVLAPPTLPGEPGWIFMWLPLVQFLLHRGFARERRRLTAGPSAV